MRFLANMGVSQCVVTWLQEQGHDATHLRDEGLQRLENGDIFTKALRESRIILTWDLDFTESLTLSKTGTVSASDRLMRDCPTETVHRRILPSTSSR